MSDEKYFSIKKYLFLASLVIIFCLCFSSCSKSDFKIYMKRCDEQMAFGRYDKAIELINEIEDKYPENQALLRSKGICLMGINDYDKAIEYFDRALKNSKNHLGSVEEDIICYKTSALSYLDKNEQAYETISSLTEKKKSKNNYILKGIMALKLGRKQEAILSFNEAIKKTKKLDTYIDIFMILNEYHYTQSGKDYLNKAIKLAQKSSDNVILGQLFYYNEEYEMAVKTLENVIKNSKAKIYLAKSLYMQGNIEKAYNISQKALESDEFLGEHYNIVGLYYMQILDYQNAIKNFNLGIRVDGHNDCELRYNEAIAYEMMGDFTTAKEKMKNLVEDYPNIDNIKREFLFLKSR